MVAPAATSESELQRRLATLSLAEKVRLLTGADVWSTYPMPQIGLKKLMLSDGPAGVRGVAWDERATSLLLPCPTALAATWDPAQAERAGRLLGAQARDKGVHVLLAPTVNLHRSPLGGRHFECYSEDPLLTTRIAAGYITGVQSADVAATIKHFVGNESETERMTYDARIDERTLRELYLAPFEAVVRITGVWAVMAAYNSVNGASMTTNHRLLTEVLKQEWGFDGLIISDWTATRSTEASALAGLDLAMPGPNSPWGEALVAAVREGRVDESIIDDKVLRLLRLAARVGALDDAAPSGTVMTPADARAQLRDLTARSVVLLHNNGLLPLDAGALRRVALIGPNAVNFTAQGGGSAHVNPAHIVTPLEGVQRALGDSVEVSLHAGVYTNRLLPPLTLDRATDPVSGAPGLRVEFYGPSGDLLAAERRDAAKFVFMPGDGPGTLPSGTHTISVRTLFTAPTSGSHQFSIAGAGAFGLRIGAQPEIDVVLAIASGDPIEAMMRPPEHRIAVELAAGDTLELTLRHTLMAGVPFTTFGLGYQPPQPSADVEIAAAVEAARQADVAIVMVGTTDEVESEGFDRDTLGLPGQQDELVTRIAAVNPRTVVVVNAGAPVIMPWAQAVAAVVWAWLPGQEGGDVLADVLLGLTEPGGRLPTSFPAAEADCPVISTTPVDGVLDYAEGERIGYRAYVAAGVQPAFPFGHGLGYTTWAYEEVAAGDDGAGGLAVEVMIRNTGARAGREVVQCYLMPADATRAALRLVGFAAVTAEAGASVTAHVAIDHRTLCQYDTTAHDWRIVSGRYRLLVGRSATDHQLMTEVTL
jgi:beta-glucosidase